MRTHLAAITRALPPRRHAQTRIPRRLRPRVSRSTYVPQCADSVRGLAA
ncbi:MAG TPA: hypothetical protein VFN24_01545 [Microbacterium sp.]|nr:hypothetical protein [Microbacterium sp.]